MSNPTLSIVISTIDKNFEKFVKNFQFGKLKNADEVIIIVQGAEELVHHSELASFNVIVEKRYGLSLSRNIGIENSSSDFCASVLCLGLVIYHTFSSLSHFFEFNKSHTTHIDTKKKQDRRKEKQTILRFEFFKFMFVSIIF